MSFPRATPYDRFDCIYKELHLAVYASEIKLGKVKVLIFVPSLERGEGETKEKSKRENKKMCHKKVLEQTIVRECLDLFTAMFFQ